MSGEGKVEEQYHDHPDDECWNCGGEGVVYFCHTEYACIDPEGGCDLCERRCAICRPRRRTTTGE